MSGKDEPRDRERVDAVFAEAVRRGIILREDTLDSCSEFDLTTMSFPVARAAVRFILNRIVSSSEGTEEPKDLTFITGVGAGKGGEGGRDTTSLREYVQEILVREGLPSTVPRLARGTVEIAADTMAAWISSRQ